MNEKIKELIEQSIIDKLTLDEFITELKSNPNEYYGFKISELDKFVELIVGECANIVEEHQPRYLTRGQAQEMANTIKQHFEGIKS